MKTLLLMLFALLGASPLLRAQSNAPTITSFYPTSGGAGDTITLIGTNLTNYLYAGAAGAVCPVVYASPDTMRIVLDTAQGASNTMIYVDYGTGVAEIFGFTYVLRPQVVSFTPVAGRPGDPITISATNLTGVKAVTFGGVPAQSFATSGSTIVAYVGNGATGPVAVTSTGGTGSKDGFTFAQPNEPIVSSFSPTTGLPGTVVTIKGTQLTNATAVTFGGAAAASFTVVDSNTITAVVGTGASGAVSVTANGLTFGLAGFYYVARAPAISGFTPVSSTYDGLVSISGSGFTGASAVWFGGTPALNFTVINDNTITAQVSTGSTGAITVAVPGDTAVSTSTFTFLELQPDITSFSTLTNTNAYGWEVVRGVGLYTTTAVSFGGVPAVQFHVYNDDSLEAQVGYGSSGAVSVKTAYGTASLDGYVYTGTAPAPAITTFDPIQATEYDTVHIHGANFDHVTGVFFGPDLHPDGVPALSFQYDSTDVWAVVGPGASGNIYIVSLGDTTYASGFTYKTYVKPGPYISEFMPASATSGATVTIMGEHFNGATAVLFGGVPAASYNVIDDNTISAVVDTGATGLVTVVANGDTASTGVFTYIAPFHLDPLTATLVNDKILLQWRARGESNHVTVYHLYSSQDGQLFTTIYTQLPHDSASNTYTYLDATAQTGKNYYFLEIVDPSGNLTYSNEDTVVLANTKVNVTPNPARGVVTVSVPTSDKPATLKIVDMQGKVFATIDIPPNTFQITVDFTKASGDIYVLSWSDGSRVVNRKMMVVH